MRNTLDRGMTLMEDQRLPDSGIEKSPTGIEGVDEITGGGLPRGRTSLLLGGPGSGKTVFALQALANGARDFGEPGIFVDFEEDSDEILQNASSFGWDLPALVASGKLAFLDVQLTPEMVNTGEFELTLLLARLAEQAKAMGATRIAFDAIDVLLTLMDDPRAERQELYRVRAWLKGQRMTGIITARVSGEEANANAQYHFLQYMADCVINLQRQAADRIGLRQLRVIKYRGAGVAEADFPFVIDRGGLVVATLGATAPELDYTIFTERVSAGVERLDTMLDGGYFRGSTVQITGGPGTGKTTLAGAFIAASCQRGDPALLVSFDEVGEEITRNLASVNIRLAPYLEQGVLTIQALRTEARSAEEHLLHLKSLIETQHPRCMVIDPITALVKAGGLSAALTVVQRLVRLTKSLGITLLCTSLTESSDPLTEAGAIQISTILDTWIHLSYSIRGGERNRALTIIKSRGTKHSDQVRELILSDAGVTMTDVYAARGEVLMGTLREERMMEEAFERERQVLEFEQLQRKFANDSAELSTRIDALRRELQDKQEEQALAQQEHAAREQQLHRQRAIRQELRGGDAPAITPDGDEETRHGAEPAI